MKSFLFLFLFLISSASFSQEITGSWHGMLAFPGGQLRLTINIKQNGTAYTATMDSPDQDAMGIPVSKISFIDNILTFAVPEGAIEYKGTLEGDKIKGTFSQNNYPIPLDLGREEIKKITPNRPQEPAPPFPYHTEDVIFRNEKDGITLAGTLSMPNKTGQFPAVILITGSGPQNRDEEILGHKPFLVLADHLTRKGFAVLRYDDRGFGASTGDFTMATTSDFSTDAGAAMAYLKGRNEINKNKIGLIGHSEGGTVSVITAADNPDVAFVVLMAGGNIPGDEQMMLQNYLLGKSSGMPEEELKKLSLINRQIYDVIKQESDLNIMKTRLLAVFNKEMRPLLISKGIAAEEVDRYVALQIRELASPWYSNFIKYDPTPELLKVKCPVLALNGEKDLQVAPIANLDAVTRSAAKSGNKKVTVKQMPGLNHLFQESATGNPAEYGKTEQTIAPAVLNEISSWMATQVQ